MKSLKNAVSIKGISSHSDEEEVLVSDHNFKVARIRDGRQTFRDLRYHIYLE